ncbi:MAG: F0F1 ATP synthase subunit epsilon [Phycisphaerales bacterium]|nr:F0F1 ATP synthase subunit epsilon [Phycisphaerales bacterium]
MADNTITCRLVTPSQELLNEQVVYASVPAWDGLIGFQHGGSPLVSRLGLGKLRLDFPASSGSGSRLYYVEDGFVEMGHNELVILAERAIPAEELIESDAKAELAEAEARVIPEDAPNKLEAVEQLTRAKERARLKLSMAQNSKAAGV